MKRMISVLDLRTGEHRIRPSSTQTFDLPRDFDRTHATATLDVRSRARYVTTLGTQIVAQVFPRPLSWRIRGEECLVADEDAGPTLDEPGKFSLVAVDPARA